MKIIFEAVDPEERKLRLRKIVDYARRNKGAFEMTPTSDPHAQTHYFARYDHAASIVGNHKAGRSPKVRRLLTARARLNRLIRATCISILFAMQQTSSHLQGLGLP